MDHQVNRRRFLGAAIGTGAAAATAGALGAPAAFGDRDHDRGRGGDEVPRSRRGMQMWSMRRLIEGEPPNTPPLQTPAQVFDRLGRMGYTEIELAGHYGLPASELRRIIERNGMRAFSGHDGPGFPPAPGWQNGYRETLEYAVEVGQKWTGLAWFGETDTVKYADETTWHALADHLNAAGEIAKREFGLQFFYHNHDFEFANKKADGTAFYNILLEETDRDLVKFELDLYWIVYGGENPVAYLSADPARFPLYHVKDRTWKDRGPTVQDWEDTGPGAIDFPDIFDAGDGRGLDKHFVIEHDWPRLSHPNDTFAEYTTAEVSVDYLRRVRW
jgi:sugar phosphate isomerase/epimerase